MSHTVHIRASASPSSPSPAARCSRAAFAALSRSTRSLASVSLLEPASSPPATPLPLASPAAAFRFFFFSLDFSLSRFRLASARFAAPSPLLPSAVQSW